MMKKILAVTLLLIINLLSHAQTDGISYQAVILDPEGQELPGVDAEGNILPHATISLRFTILDPNNNVLYQEVQTTNTDQYGMINTRIGKVDPVQFETIEWDGNQKNMKVEIDFSGSGGGYIDLSQQELLFLPFAYHRNITATGTLKVEGITDLNNTLNVNKLSPTNLSGTLKVTGITNLLNSLNVNYSSPTTLTGTLSVDGVTNLNDALKVNNSSHTDLSGKLTVEGVTDLNDALNINNSSPLNLSGALTVGGITQLNDSLSVKNQSPTNLTGSLNVVGASNLNDALSVNNSSPTNLSGSLLVTGTSKLIDTLTVENLSPAHFTGKITVDGVTKLNDAFSVQNDCPTNLTGALIVKGAAMFTDTLTVDNLCPTNLKGSLSVDGKVIFNDTLKINNSSPMSLSGNLSVNGRTNLNDALSVNNASPTYLSGTLIIDGKTDLVPVPQGLKEGGSTENATSLTVNGTTNLNGSFNVKNASPATFSGNVAITGRSNFGDTLKVQNESPTLLTGRLKVSGPTEIKDTLTVQNSSPTNLTGGLKVLGIAEFKDTLKVQNSSPVLLTGGLTVNGITELNNELMVKSGHPTFLRGELIVGMKTTLFDSLRVMSGQPTILTGDLTVDGNTKIDSLSMNGGLDVNGIVTMNNTSQSTTKDDGALIVKGGVGIEKNLNISQNVGVGINADANLKMNISGGSDDHIMSIENTNNDEGDGLLIKLGKRNAKTANWQALETTLKAYFVGGVEQDDIDWITSLLTNNNPDYAYPLQFGLEFIQEAYTDLPLAACRIAEAIVTPLADLLNDEWGLPHKYDFPDPVGDITLIPKIEFPSVICDLGNFKFGLEDFPGFILVDTDYGAVLNNTNEFISFQDDGNVQLGSIKAQSLTDWATIYLSNVFMFELVERFIGLDVPEKIIQIHALIKDVSFSYLNIGVEYSSGNGDYAEWLERINPNEEISSGDIVGIRAGKITKNLKEAEQIMAVSFRPIVLGNVPPEGEAHLGNNVAFMGQVPVKIMGPINAGDYVVGKSDIAGYGVAVSPKNMTIEDYRLAVGRSWDSLLADGPKMVNTVVGVHNGDYFNVLKKYEQKFTESEKKFENINKRLELIELKFSNSKSNGSEL